MSPLDLHVLGTPPAFVLSQDQTLLFNPSMPPSLRPLSEPPLGLHLNSSESSLSLPRPSPPGSERFSSLRVSSLSVSFSRFGPLPPHHRPFGWLSRASFVRISKMLFFVKHFFQFFSDFFSELFSRPAFPPSYPAFSAKWDIFLTVRPDRSAPESSTGRFPAPGKPDTGRPASWADRPLPRRSGLSFHPRGFP